MSPLHPGQLYHVGVVAEDIDKAKIELAALGLTFRGGKPRSMDLILGGEPRTLEMRIAHSEQGPPHVELIQAVPDSPWAQAGAGVHHVCYWSEDVAAAGRALEAAGYTRIMGQAGGGGYFQSGSSVIVEIIPTSTRDFLTSLVSGDAARSAAGSRSA